jgi:ribosomal protein L11 methyltransferase
MAWQRLTLVVPGPQAEGLADALGETGALATDITDADAGTAEEQAVFGEPGAIAAPWPNARLTALFAAGADVAALLRAACSRAGISPPPALTLDALADADWVRETQAQFEPIRAGKRLWIVPTWCVAPEPGAINLVLDPGAAFGTGSHPTTRLCLEWLEVQVRAGDRVLDYGCGSGILAIAAMKLGAAAAAGVDIDPLALEAAGYNAQVNGVPLDVRTAGETLDFLADITVANILANPLRMLAPLLATHTAARGRIALSGILAAQADEVAAAYAPWFDIAVDARDGDWVRLAGAKRR